MPRYAYKCCIKNCPGNGIHSHRFPNPKTYFDHFNRWVCIIGGELHNLDLGLIYEKKRVCAIHFTENDTSPGTDRLKRNAVPTLHLPSKSGLENEQLDNVFQPVAAIEDDLHIDDHAPDIVKLCIICCKHEALVTMVPCFHKFCNVCVLRLIQHEQIVRCPTCKEQPTDYLGLIQT